MNHKMSHSLLLILWVVLNACQLPGADGGDIVIIEPIDSNNPLEQIPSQVIPSSFKERINEFQVGDTKQIEFVLGNDFDADEVIFQVWHHEFKRFEGTFVDNSKPFIFPSSELNSLSPGRVNFQVVLRKNGVVLRADQNITRFDFVVKEAPTPDARPIPAPAKISSKFKQKFDQFELGDSLEVEFLLGTDYDADEVFFQVWRHETNEYVGGLSDKSKPFLYPSNKMNELAPGRVNFQVALKKNGRTITTDRNITRFDFEVKRAPVVVPIPGPPKIASKFKQTFSEFQLGEKRDVEFLLGNDYDADEVLFQIWRHDTNRFVGSFSDRSKPFLYSSDKMNELSPGRVNFQVVLKKNGRVVATDRNQTRFDILIKRVPPIKPDSPNDDEIPMATLRLLNGKEYSNTMKSLLRIDDIDEFEFSDTSTGFSTGGTQRIDKNLFSELRSSAAKLADEYYKQKAKSDYSCLNSVSDSCIKSFIEGFGEKAYRRPLSSEEKQELFTVYSKIKVILEDNVEAFKYLLSHMLTSPNLLYRSEVGRLSAGRFNQLDQYELASMISYSLTGDRPDDSLYNKAKRNQLKGKGLSDEVRRIIQTKQAKSWMIMFFKEWLSVTDIDRMALFPQDFSKFANNDQAKSLRDEFHYFIEKILFNEQKTLKDLFLTNRVFVNRHTDSLYGKSVSSTNFQEIDGSNRVGILTLASVMAVHSSRGDKDLDNPVLRGQLINEKLLCSSVGFPSGLDISAAADNIADDHPQFESYTVRRQYEAVMQQDQSCIACHSQFMPYGYMFSNFNAIGNYKTTQKNQSIDASVDRAFIGRNVKSYDNIAEFLPELVESEEFSSCYSNSIVRFLSGDAGGSDTNYQAQLMNYFLELDEFNFVSTIEKMLSAEELHLRRKAQ